MSKRLWQASGALLLSGCLVFAALLPVAAGDKKEPPRGKATAESKAVEKVELAGRLIRFGRQDQSPTALLLAAEILHQAREGKGDRFKTEEKAVADAKQTFAAQAKQLVEEASKMNGADEPAVKALAARVTKLLREEARGPEGGNKIFRGTLPSNSGWRRFFVRFDVGIEAHVSLRNLSNNADLDVQIYDPVGNMVGGDYSTDKDAYIRFTPWQSGLYRIEVRNYSGPMASFELYCS